MLETLFGSVTREKVLLFIYARGEGYAREIARYFKTDLDPVQKQFERLEYGGLFSSRNLGRTRVYTFNPRYPFLTELKNLLEKVGFREVRVYTRGYLPLWGPLSDLLCAIDRRHGHFLVGTGVKERI